MSEQRTAETESEAQTDILSQNEQARYQRMVLNEAWMSLALLAFLIGLLARQGAFTILGVVLIVVSIVARTWSRYALRRVTYDRQLQPRRAFIGETVDLLLTIENRKLLPIGWLRISDEWPEDLALAKGADDLHTGGTAGQLALRNDFSLHWYERVRRRYQIRCDARGYYRLGPARAISGDIFGMYQTECAFSTIHWLIVYPRILPIDELGLPPKDPFGSVKARQRIFEDPSRTIGVRDHHPEDEFRRIHWKASARKQELQVKVYEPTTSFTPVVFLNVATFDKYWQGTIPELLERCITVAASICHYAAEKRYVVGLVANGSIPRSDQPIRVLPGRDPQQLTRILEALAAVTPVANTDISELLTRESARLSWGATLVVVTAHVNRELEATLLRLHAAGRRLVLVSLAETPPDPLVSEEILTYHLPDAASAYYPLQTGATRELGAVAQRDVILGEWASVRAIPGGAE